MAKERNKKMYVIYKHTNLINGKVYIGQTCNLYERWRCGGKNYFGSVKFYNAIKKYGWDNFSHEILFSNLDKRSADILEKELIEKYDSIKNGYNLKTGGSRGELQKESLQKMSRSLRRGYQEHPERRKKISDSKKGIHLNFSTEHRKGLNHRKSILITIDGDTGSIRYWASKIGMTHPSLLRWLKLRGIDYLTLFIKGKLAEPRLFE